MGYNEKELLGKVEKEKNEQQEKQDIVLPPKKETIGDVLKKKREESGKSIEFISDALRIKSQYLKALEENRFNSLPGQAYVIGFIKSYASFLGISDVQKLINQYKAENNQVSNDALKISDENSIMEDPIINSNHIIVGSFVMIVGVILIYLFTNKDNIQQDFSKKQTVVETDVVTSPAENVEIVLPSSLDKVEENTDSNQSEDVFVKEEEKSEPQTFNFVNIVDNNEQQLEYSSFDSIDTDSMYGEISTPATHTPREYGLNNKADSQIELKAKDTVWIKLKKDGFYKYDSENGDIGTGVNVFEAILESGDVYYVPNDTNLYLTIGNAQGIDIIVNGVAINPLSTKPLSRHNIEMDVEKLQNGTAYIRNRIIE